MVAYATYTTATAVLGSFAFGYSLAGMNTSVNEIARALKWCGEDIIYCNSQDLYASLVTGGFFIGSALGAGCGGSCAHFGRRRMMLVADGIITLACVLCCLTPSGIGPLGSFLFLLGGRAVLGFGCGLLLVLIPMYISEWVPVHLRATYGCFHQILITLGIFTAVAAGFALESPPIRPKHGTASWPALDATFNDIWWRGMQCVAVLPCIFQASLLLLQYRSETPLHCVIKGKLDDARSALGNVVGVHNVDDALDRLIREDEDSRVHASRGITLCSALRSPIYRPILAIGMFMTLLQQLVGINLAVASGDDLFLKCGLSGEEAQIASCVMTFVHVLVTLGAARFVRTAGRRLLLLISFCGMGICMVSACLFTLIHTTWAPYGMAFSMIAFICFFASGVGPLTWVVNAELFPLEIRPKAMAVAVAGNQVCAFLVIVVSTQIANLTVLYAGFALVNVVGFVFVSMCFDRAGAASISTDQEMRPAAYSELEEEESARG